MMEGGSLLLNVSELAQQLAVSKRTIWWMVAAGKCPSPISLGRAKRWLAREVQAWVQHGCPARVVWDAIWKLQGRKGN